jgi:hypothetical protein
MTITGKCDVCRARKVKVSIISFAYIHHKPPSLRSSLTVPSHRLTDTKFYQCDEEKPKCGACRKKDRQCSYSYGKVTTFVAEDPLQLSKHGKPASASSLSSVLTWTDSDPGSSRFNSPSSNSTSPDDLQVTTTKTANDDKGVYMTLSYPSRQGSTSVRKRTAQERKKLQNHLNRLRGSSELTLYRPSSPESTLAARYLDILGPRSLKDQPFVMLGSWIETIPSRIGLSPVVDLALEYFADSFAVFRGDSFSTRRVALVSKSKALKQLQLVVSDDQTRATYNTVLAMKIHFVAEVCVPCRTPNKGLTSCRSSWDLKPSIISFMPLQCLRYCERGQ